MKYSKHSFKSKFLSGKGFYLVLAVGIAAVGISAWSAASTIIEVEENLTSSYHSLVPAPQQSSQPSTNVGQNVSDVEDTRSEVSSKAPVSSAESTSSKAPSFAMPLENATIGKGYSDKTLQYSKTFGDMRLHLGIDVNAKEGSNVLLPAKGTIKNITEDKLWGNMITVDHGSGITVIYCGIKNVSVNVGEKLSAGVKLGQVGVVPSECADESHIHVAVMKDGKYIAPTDLLSLRK